MKRVINLVCTLACACLSADEWAASVDVPQTGSRVVIQDHTYILFSEHDYAILTNKMDFLLSISKKRWNLQHATESGRVAWHGKAKGQTVETHEDGSISRIITYEDGYRHVEKSVKKSEHKQTIREKAIQATREQRKFALPERLRKARGIKEVE